MSFYTTAASPIGRLLMTADDGHITGLYTPGKARKLDLGRRDPAPFRDVLEELDRYWNGERTRFRTRIAPQGTPFQQRVWAALRKIPYGRTTSYGELARAIGHPRAVRAVGHANARNPISIIVPCHRVIGANGTLTGYAGGLDRKVRLLELEGVRCRL